MDVFEDDTSFDQSSFKERSKITENELFHDAIDHRGRSAVHQDTRIAPSIESPDGKSQTDATDSTRVEIRQESVKRRLPYFTKYYPRSTRYSVGVQTIPEGERSSRNKSSKRRMDTNPEIETVQHLESHSFDDDVYVDAMESLSDYHDVALELEGDKRRNTSGVKSGGCRKSKSARTSCPAESLRESGFGTQYGCRESTMDQAQSGLHDSSCCPWLLTVIYWLALMLFMSFLLSLFFTIFLLFSRNHGLGIGPALLYSDVDFIRNHVDPYLDLRHNGVPPT